MLHASLTVGDGLLMGSDDPTTDQVEVQGVMVSYSAADAHDARRVFAALSEGGQVNQELIETSFSPAFGMCVDRFGTPWMVVSEAPEQG